MTYQVINVTYGGGENLSDLKETEELCVGSR